MTPLEGICPETRQGGPWCSHPPSSWPARSTWFGILVLHLVIICRNMHLKQDNLLDLISIQIWTCSGNEETIRAGLLQWAGVDWQCRAQTNQIYFLNFFTQLHSDQNYSDQVEVHVSYCPSSCVGMFIFWGRKESHGKQPIALHWFAPQKIYHWPPIQSKFKGMLSIHASSQVKNCFHGLRRKIQTMLPCFHE